MRSTCVAVVTAVALAAGAARAGGPAADLHKLDVLTGGYPRAFFFRAAEGMAANQRIPYGRWEQTFGRLMGIEGKVLEEEVPGRSVRNIDFFTRFKAAHPRQLVLLHYNGNARDPRYRRGEFFAGHWIYHEAAKVVADVPASDGVMEIRVDRPGNFRVNIGRYRTANDDVGLCELDDRGRPDWHRSEQVQLVSVDAGRGVIRVRRGCYGTRPRAFRAGRAVAAAHATEGPWGKKSHLLWYHNYSTRCPRDERGRACADVLAAELARRFSPGGELAAFDGVEFDVLQFTRGRRRGPRALDCDADGKGDNGFFDGVNTYGLGVLAFSRALRKKLPGKLLLADGHGPQHQRSFGVFNGIESEGWPTLSDPALADWSGGLNRHFFWAARARKPALNYVNHKFVVRGGAPGVVRRPEVPWSTHRLVFAAAVFTDSAICYSFAAPREPGELFGVWDELWMGRDRRVGWLGRPTGPAVRLATRQDDLLGGAGTAIGQGLLRRLEGEDVRFTLDGGHIKVAAAKAALREIRFRLKGVPCAGEDLFVSLTARAAAMRGYPGEVARLTTVGVAADEGVLVRPELPATGMCLRGEKETTLDREAGAEVRFYARRSLAGQTHSAYFLHPPFRGRRKGYAFWRRDVKVPAAGRIELHLGMGERSPQRSDGVTFRVLAAELRDGRPAEFAQLFQHVQKASRWTRHTISLAKYAGRRIRLKFVSDCGPKDNATTDHSYWGDVCVVGRGGRAALRPAQRFMTWTDTKPFRSGFSFGPVRSRQVDLEVTVEGGEPFWMQRVSAHAHPDAMYREFENGLVLANPSPRPQTFDLARLLPGRRFRRLRGTSRQDPATNDGSPVGATIALPAKDALFLVKRSAGEK